MKTKQLKQKQTQQFEKNKGVCFRCKGKIYPNSNYLKLITMNDAKVVEHVEFHLPSCWQEFNNDKVNERIKSMAALGLKALKPMLESSARFNY